MLIYQNSTPFGIFITTITNAIMFLFCFGLIISSTVVATTQINELKKSFFDLILTQDISHG